MASRSRSSSLGRSRTGCAEHPTKPRHEPRGPDPRDGGVAVSVGPILAPAASVLQGALEAHQATNEGVVLAVGRPWIASRQLGVEAVFWVGDGHRWDGHPGRPNPVGTDGDEERSGGLAPGGEVGQPRRMRSSPGSAADGVRGMAAIVPGRLVRRREDRSRYGVARPIGRGPPAGAIERSQARGSKNRRPSKRRKPWSCDARMSPCSTASAASSMSGTSSLRRPGVAASSPAMRA